MIKPFRMTSPYTKLLIGTADTPMGLYHLHIALPNQLTRLHYAAGSLNGVKLYLKRLTDHGYVQPVPLPVRAVAHPEKSPYSYTLSQKGVDYVSRAGLDTSGYHLAREEDKHDLFLRHTLALNEVLVAAMCLGRLATGATLSSFKHEHQLKRTPYKATWQGGKFTIVPDALLDFHALHEGRMVRRPVLLEHDMGTEEREHFSRRIRAYVALLKAGAYQELFDVKVISRIVFTTFKGVKRLEQMRQWTRSELANEGEDFLRKFYFATLPEPPEASIWLEPVWYSVHENTPPQAVLAV
jgi:hypothetical protein